MSSNISPGNCSANSPTSTNSSTSKSSPHNYIYAGPMAALAGHTVLNYEQQRQFIQAQNPNLIFEFVFSEENSSSEGKALALLERSVQAGDKIYIWSRACLVSEKNLDSLTATVSQFVHKIHKTLGCSLVLVSEQIDTASPRDRLVLTNLVASEQYQFDLSAQKTTSSCSCSSSSTSK